MQIENRNEFRNRVASRRPRIRSDATHRDTVLGYLECDSSRRDPNNGEKNRRGKNASIGLFNGGDGYTVIDFGYSR